ncbi:hypothetical protein Hypma_001296 [Hypsizygus marmoreus]|uniref:Uncharacterized protein n=1 Tax=Hypsizygus marmoreus TaxID=39966 RepID=A0A369K0N8_HYPMA|nr:hypothetical protein Hypma_001296 [Hypsizygus marmoreus]
MWLQPGLLSRAEPSKSLDPTPQTLSRYIAYTSQFIASGPKYLTGVRHFLRDIYPDFDDNRSHPLVQSTIRGSKKVRADPVTRKLPLRPAHLSAFLQVARSTRSYEDLLFTVILSCCFYACHRSGELVQKNDKSLFDWRKVIRRSSLVFDGDCAQYHLPYHKADPFYRGTTVMFLEQDIADPVSLLREYCALRDACHGAASALFICEDGSHPTRSWFDSKFFALLDRQFGGHSARAGGATFYAGLGLSEDIIQALGRWSSAAWKIYIRDNPAVRAALQLAALRLPTSPHMQSFLGSASAGPIDATPDIPLSIAAEVVVKAGSKEAEPGNDRYLDFPTLCCFSHTTSFPAAQLCPFGSASHILPSHNLYSTQLIQHILAAPPTPFVEFYYSLVLIFHGPPTSFPYLLHCPVDATPDIPLSIAAEE